MIHPQTFNTPIMSIIDRHSIIPTTRRAALESSSRHVCQALTRRSETDKYKSMTLYQYLQVTHLQEYIIKPDTS